MARINYIEIGVGDIAGAKAFYANAFGWQMTDFGSTYASTTDGITDLGLQADAAEARGAPLPVIEVDDIEAALGAVTAAGGAIIIPIFAYPGGRRFHFKDPAGNELAVSQPA